MSDPESTANEKPGRQTSISAVLALLASLVSVTLSAYVWYMVVYKNADLLNQSIPARVQALREELNLLNSASQENSSAILKLQNEQKVLADATRKAYSDISRSRNKWAVSEIEQLLIIANQRMQLANDFETAAIALQAADSRLQSLADPELTPVRKQLAKEINQIKSVERADLSGLNLRLASLIDSVETLPLSLNVVYQKEEASAKQDKKPAAAKPSGKAPPAANTPQTEKPKPASEQKPGFFVELWQDITGLFQFRSNSGSYKPLLPPEQQYFLRENLRLLLLGAQQALLRNETEIYIHNLGSARRWVNQYFDTHSQAIRHLNSELEALSKTKLVRKTPNISGSLSLLRKLTQGIDKG